MRFGGVQWGTNFATDPNFVTFPLPVIGGLSEQQSVIEVVTENVSRITTEVPAGPFRLGNIPVVTGAGELQVTVTDLLGREQTVTQPYYVSSKLLKEGLHDFAYEAGFTRQDFGNASFEYGDPLLATTHRYGLTNGLTLEAHGEADLDGATLIGGGAATLGGFGVISGGVGGSGGDSGEGVFGQLAFDYRQAGFNVGARSRYTSKNFRRLGRASSAIEREDQFNFGLSLGNFARLGALFLNREFHNFRSGQSITGSLAVPVLGGSLVLNTAHTFEPERDTAVIAAFSLPLSRTRSISTFAEHRDGNLRGRTQYRRNRGRTDLGLDYRLGVEYGDQAPSLDGRFDYHFPLVSTSMELERTGGDARMRAGVSGSLALIEGKFGLSRPLGRAFGMVDLPGYPDVRVFVDNRNAGRTDAAGRLILPSLRPYQRNEVKLAVEDLPLDTKVMRDVATAVPMAGTGIRVPLEISNGRSAIATLVAADGEPLPAGIMLISADERVQAQVARGGLAQIDGMLPIDVRVSGGIDGQTYSCVITGIVESDGPFPDLGTINCEP